MESTNRIPVGGIAIPSLGVTKYFEVRLRSARLCRFRIFDNKNTGSFRKHTGASV